MTRLNFGKTAACVALLGAMFAPRAPADEWNRKTRVTFSVPVEIPGVHVAGWGVLPPGTYVFKILDSQSDRHIVQILNSEETTTYATILAIPNYRLKATDKTVMTFRERPAGEPEALRAWFYPGRNWGEEFVYPKAKAIELAKATQTPVLFTPAEIPAEVAGPLQTAAEPLLLEMRKAPVLAMSPAGEEVQLAEIVTPPPAEAEVTAPAPAPTQAAVQASAAPAPARQVDGRLPDTSSMLPLIGLLGLMTLVAAFAVRAARNRID